MPKGTSFDDYLNEKLKDPKMAAGYIRAVIEEDDPELFIDALSMVMKIHGISKLAEETGIARQSLYQMTSEEGNPTLKNVSKILDKLGLELTVRPKKKKTG